jgi:uracil-DNA glycosylase family 4
MEPTGAAKPTAYILGEGPGEQEDLQNEQFVGPAGTLLRSHIPPEWRKRIRYNNVVRTRPKDNDEPDAASIECCRPSVTRDIEQSKPTAIFGFGNIPLHWAIGQRGIEKWRGRRIPVKIGTHTCWFYPMLHPSYVLRTGRSHSPFEHVFRLDIERALAECENLPEPIVHDRETAFVGVEVATSVEQIEWFLIEAMGTKLVGVDIETSSLRPYRENTRLLSLAVSAKDRTLAFPYHHPKAKWTFGQSAKLYDLIGAFLRSPVRKTVHNLPFELEWFGARFGLDTLRAGEWDDSQSQAAILDERVGAKPRGDDRQSMGAECFGLGFLTRQYFGINIKDLTDIDVKHIIDAPLQDMLLYNGVDAKYHRLLYLAQRERLKREGLQDFYTFHKRRLPTIVLTQLKGIPLDNKEAVRQEKALGTQLITAGQAIQDDEAAQRFKKQYREQFNPLSNNDCVKLLRDVLKSDAGVLKNGKYSATKSVLTALDHPIGKKILAYKEPAKLLSTYIWTKDSPIVYPDGMLHPILNANFAESGRLSSEDPNEQNFPKRNDEGKKIRKQIRAPNGHTLFSVDYGQIEARCIAMASCDKVFVKALREDYDVHGEWARKIANVYPKRIGGEKNLDNPKVMKEYRQVVKGGWVFALFFDAQLATAARQVGVPEELLRDLYDEFWATFAGVKQWQNDLKKSFAKKGYVETLMGRRRRAPLSPNQVVNTSIQGLAADIVVDGMDRLSETGDWDLQPILQIHDDLTSLFPEDRFEKLARTKIDTLLTVKYDFLNVPLVVEASVGTNLYAMEEVATYSSQPWGK